MTSACVTKLDLPDPDTPVTAVITPSGNAASSLWRLLQLTPSNFNQPRGCLRSRTTSAGSAKR